MPRILRRPSFIQPLLVLSLFLLLISLPSGQNAIWNELRPTASAASTFTVNSTGDGADSNLGDGLCNDGTGACTLRAAIQQANAAVSADVINFNLPANSTITLNTALEFIGDDLDINGPGANTLTVQRSTAGGTPRFSIFIVTSPPIVVNIAGLTVSNGHTIDGPNAASGGGIVNDLGATLNLTNVVVKGNRTGNGDPGSGGFGGGIFNFGTMTVTGSTVSGNTTGTGGSDPGAFGGYGAGIHNSGTLTLINSTVSGNTTGNSASLTQGGYGAGIFNSIGCTLTVINSTISNNQTGSGGLGGGIRNEASSADFKDTIVANNHTDIDGASGPDLSGNFNSLDYNLIRNPAGATITGMTAHNMGGIDPLLGPLAANGGPTLTHALLALSPAIDGGNSALGTDQRGQPRPVDDPNIPNAAGGNASDIGAYEAHTLQVNSTVDATDGACAPSGTGNGCTLREAIIAANAETGVELITFAPDLTSGGPATIALMTVLPDVSSDLFISGPGASLLTVQRSIAGAPEFRVFTISSGRTVSISGLTIRNGLLSGGSNGGAIFNDGSTLDLANIVVSGNSATNGGGILNSNDGILNLTNSSVTGNSAAAGAGGGIFNNRGTLTVVNSTVSGNTCGNQGGAINNFGGAGGSIGVVTLINSTVSGNTATENGGIGGIANSPGANIVTLSNSTVTSNIASGSAGGGVAGISNASGSTFNLKNSIVAKNTPADGSGIFHDLNGTFTSQGYNLVGISNGTNGFTNGVNGDQVGSPAVPLDPLLGPLANNGGPTFTHALLQGSPAVDSANSLLVTDQRGQPRPLDDPNIPNAAGGNASDIGAYEANTLQVNSTADASDGECAPSGTGNGCTLREAIIAANAEPGPELITFAPALTSGGPVTISLLTVLPDLSSDMVIAGPGASLLTVERSRLGGTPDFRVFKVTAGKSVAISGLTIANGVAGGATPNNFGGNLLNDQGTVEINNCVLKDSVVGGAVGNFSGSMTITGSTLSGNIGSTITNAVPQGGSTTSPATLTINSSTLSGNTGATIWNTVITGNAMSPATVTINNSTISGNTATGGGTGAGIRNGVGVGGTATITINNSTLSGNINNDGVGAIYNAGVFTGPSPTISTITVNNSTIFSNAGASGSGASGGIANIVSSCSPCVVSVKLNNTILAGNSSNGGATASDFSGTADPTSSFNIIGAGGSGGLINGVNNNQVGITNVRLMPLANNGGPTQTHALFSGSPALDAGDNALAMNVGLTTDQRGPGFLRIRDGVDADSTQTVDVGAFEADPSVEDIADKNTSEDNPISFSFNVADTASAFTSVTATSSNTTLVPNAPANLNVTGSGATRTLDIAPAANQFGNTLIVVTATKTIGSTPVSMIDSFLLTVGPTADTPSVTNAQANEDSQNFSGLVITRNAGDGAEVTHFKITGITNGTLFKNNDVTPINNGDFISAFDGGAGLRFHPNPNFFGTGNFNVQASLSNTDAGLGGGIATATITVGAVAETPSVTNATTTINTQTSSGLVITRNPIDGPEISHFRIESIQNGQLFKNDGVTQITSMSNITVVEGNAGLKFTPGTNLTSPATTFSFLVRGATSAGASGFGGAATATITVSCDASTVVTNTNDSGAGSLRDAILNACPGGVVTFNIPTSDPGFSGGVYTITLTSGELLLGKNLTINGLGRDVLTVRRSSAGGTLNFRIFTINSSVTVSLSGMTIANGSTAGLNGGGILNSGTLSLSDIKISGNRTGDGVTAGQGGNGGGLYSSGPVTMIDSIVSDNLCGKGSPGGPGGSGGGILSLGTMTITNSTISDNRAGAAGMVPGSGGGIAASGTLTITNSTISGNQTASGMSFNGNGGGISNSGTLRVTGSTISNNSSSSGGGGVLSFAGTVTLINSIISGNQSNGGGGGVNGLSPVTIINCLVTSNAAPDGGGLLVQTSNSTVINTTISGNSSTGRGGGLYVSSTVTLSNLTIVNNRSDSDNSGGELGGGFFPQGPQTIKNSIVAGNFRGSGSTTADDITGTLNTADSSFNLIGTGGSGGLTNGVNNNQVGVADARLGPLAANGGPTQTILPLPSSTAIDAGNVSNLPADTFDLDGDGNIVEPLPVDQRGFARVVNTNFDIGAAETNYTIAATAGTPQSATINSAFATQLQATVKDSNVVQSGVSVTFTAPAAGASGTFAGGATTATVTTNASGIATAPIFTANGTAGGPYNVVASLTSGLPTATFSLTNNQSPPSVTINDVSITEGNSGTKTANLTVTLSAASSLPVTVDFATANGSATAGSDYQATSGTLTFNPGQTTQPVGVVINGDVAFETDETFVVNLSNAVNAAIGDAQGAGTILNDDAQGGFVSFSQANYTIGESGGSITITVNRGNNLSGAATVDYFTSESGGSTPCSTVNGLASSRCDFTTSLGTLRFGAGESAKTFTVLISQDNYVEGPESLALALANPTGGAAFVTPSTATLTITDDASEPAANPADDPDVFVRQHYHDFLNREADAPGLAFWTNQITECQQPGATCSAEVRRINVSAAFFLSIEFQETGYLVYRTYKSAYGNIAGTPVPLRLIEFLPDTQQIGKGVQVGVGNWEAQLESNKVAYALDFVSRARFVAAYPTTLTPAEFVDALFANGGVTPSATDRDAAIAEFGGAGNTSNTAARARALRRVAENATLKQQEFNRAFVLMQYFGYLRRNPNDAPEANLDFGGYNFWLGKLNEFNGNFVNAEMVKAFIVSGEYRQRFGQ